MRICLILSFLDDRLHEIYKTNEKYKPITDFILKYDETSVNPNMVEKNNNEG